MTKKTNTSTRSRKGITITEVAVALVIIGIISSAALSLVMYSVNVERESFAIVEAENIADNALACFRYAEDYEEFCTVLQKTGDFEIQDDDSLLLNGNGYTVTIKPDYENNYFEYNAVNQDGEEIYSFRYPNVVLEGGLNDETPS